MEFVKNNSKNSSPRRPGSKRVPGKGGQGHSVTFGQVATPAPSARAPRPKRLVSPGGNSVSLTRKK